MLSKKVRGKIADVFQEAIPRLAVRKDDGENSQSICGAISLTSNTMPYDVRDSSESVIRDRLYSDVYVSDILDNLCGKEKLTYEMKQAVRLFWLRILNIEFNEITEPRTWAEKWDYLFNRADWLRKPRFSKEGRKMALTMLEVTFETAKELYRQGAVPRICDMIRKRFESEIGSKTHQVGNELTHLITKRLRETGQTDKSYGYWSVDVYVREVYSDWLESDQTLLISAIRLFWLHVLIREFALPPM